MMVAGYIISGLIAIALIVLTLEFSILIPPKKGLPILMYHKISAGSADGLTIPSSKLEQQFDYIVKKGYQTISFAELKSRIENRESLPLKPLIITFDDAYKNFDEYSFPLLTKYKLKATLFIPVAYMGKTNIWDKGIEPILNPERLKELSQSGIVELGLHSFIHRNYAEMTPEEMQEDIDNCINSLTSYSIPFARVLAYPYGGYPKKDKELKEKMKEIFREKKLDFAVRIGNRINGLPVKEPYELKRIDIRGTDNFFAFKTKIHKGRMKLFS
jgi:peptidoglycan/xylan/chitin deacetylase (PgdA/CDA1 family)